MTTSRIGPYDVIRPLGQGHYGAVSLARGEDGRSVAIKQLHGEWSMHAFETLVHEFELLERVKHRSLCKVYTFLDREMAVVMEFVDGLTLREVIDGFSAAGERIWPEAVLEIGCELADCLYQAHATPGPDGEPLGLVHRDIKPENVMITPSGEVKLLDFGLAMVSREADASVAGTPVYMAPEQARGESLDPRSDLFSVGLVLFELLAGEPMYAAPDDDRTSAVDAVLARIAHADVAETLQRGMGQLPRLQGVLARCLAADREDRPADGHVLLVELRRCRGPEARGALAEFCDYAFRPGGPLRVRGPATVQGPSSGRGGEGPNMPANNDDPRPDAPPRQGAPPRPRPRPTSRPVTGGQMWSPPDKPVKRPPPVVEAPGGEDLRMVPLVDQGSDPELGEGPPAGATQFFVHPKQRSLLADDDEGPAMAAPPGPVAVAGPVPGVQPGVAGVAPPLGMAPVGISGPVAGGQPPLAAIPGVQAPPAAAEVNRAQSYRVFAVLIGLMFMVCTVLVITSVATVYAMYNWQETASTDPQVSTPTTRGVAPVDTGIKAKPRPVPPIAAPVRPRPRVRPAAPAPVAAPTKGRVTLRLEPGSPPFTAVEVKCAGSSERNRVSFSAGTAVVEGVPVGDCKAYFKGGPPAVASVSAGDSLTCTFDGGTASCR